MVPNDLKEGAYSLGATRAEVVRKIIFPVAGSGIFSSYVLAIGRALGETMTVTMLIGNTNNIPNSITSTGNSMASIIANQFGEANDLRLSSLIALGLVLFLITALINMIGKIMIKTRKNSLVMNKLRIKHRLAKDKLMLWGICLLAALTAVPLLAILGEVLLRGYDQLSWAYGSSSTTLTYKS